MNAGHLIYLIFLIELFLCGFWFTNSPVTQAFLLVTAVVGFRAVLFRGTVLAYSLFGLMLAYLLWLFIVAFNSKVPYTSMMTLATLANLPVLYLVATNTPTFAEIWKYLRTVLFVTGVFFALWGLGQATHDVWYGAVVGPLHDSNLFAALINVLWFPAAFLFLNSRSAQHPWKTILIGSGLFIMTVALFATASRGGIGTWMLLLPVLLWAGYRNVHTRPLVIFIPFIAILAYLFSVEILQIDFLNRNLELSQDPSMQARLLLWQSTIKMALAHPFAGSGWGTFASYYQAYRSPLEDTSAGYFSHSDYLQMAAEGGILGLLLLLALMLSVMVQLKRTLRRVADLAGLESLALLLGVSALFIHASVNFIFYVAFMNILAAIYLARAAQLTDASRPIKFASIGKMNPALRRSLAGLFMLCVTLPLVPNLAAELLNQESNIKVENLISPELNAYKIAKLITRLKPEEIVAQEIVLRTAELGLADKHFLNRMSVSFQRELLKETLERFETVRTLTANNPKIGVRQAKILIKHHAILNGDGIHDDAAYAKAHQVLSANLEVDPYHADSIILLSRLYAMEGRRTEALDILKKSEHRVFGLISQQLINVEILRQTATPKLAAELEGIEKQLHLLRSDPQVFKLSALEGGLMEDIDSRLRFIKSQMSEASE